MGKRFTLKARASNRALEHDMQQQEFAAFFKVATDHDHPHDYQRRLACGEREDKSDAEWLCSGTECTSRLISIPTGMGKTAAVTLAWIWNRVVLGNDKWPRRLVYCLPMRTLVEQTSDEINNWLQKLSLAFPDNAGLKWLAERSPVVLMGGEDNDDCRREWDIYPEKPAILIGTQDMLLSRALNRGYGMSRARWPMHFALLNNDCLWVMDEVQLMGPGLWTSAQLDWLRQDRFKPARPCYTWWMSATIGAAFLKTKDRMDSRVCDPEKLEEADIIKAVRPVSNWRPSKVEEQKERAAYIAALAKAIRSEHAEHTLSLVVCNTVLAAQDIFTALGSDNAILLTSRFRRSDREATLGKLLAFEKARKKALKGGSECLHEGLICVATQVVEAGVDVSARRLWTEFAPWPSILQRLGRLNRDGNHNADAAAHLFEMPADKNAVAPYDPDDLKAAKKIIKDLVKKCGDASTKPIREIIATLETGKTLEAKPAPFPRAFDVHGLFSTEPDIFGGFTDVSAWVRGTDKNADVTVFWRDWDAAKKSPNSAKYAGPAFQRDEGCAVAVYRVRDFLKKVKTAFIWNDRSEKWISLKVADLCPGMVVLLPASGGGYGAMKGWTGSKDDAPLNTPPPGPFDAEGENNDTQTTSQGQWLSLDAHLAAVAAKATEITEILALPDHYTHALVHSAELHDIGKSIPQWQVALPTPRPDDTTLWAKAPSFAKRPGMRHEAASALAAWHQYYHGHASELSALVIYLIAAHHGLVRTVLNSRTAPAKQPNVAGIPIDDPPPALPFNNWQLDFTPATDGGSGTFSADGSTFTPGTPGWTALVADLLGGWEADSRHPTSGAVAANEPHSLNPFVLAYLETLLRAADARASADTNKENLPL